MVGHTGIYEAAVTAVESTDSAIGTIWEACQRLDYVLFVTADHGNAEQMISESGGPHTAHTCNKGARIEVGQSLLFFHPHGLTVPFVMTANAGGHFRTDVEEPALCDVAPTILTVMGLPIPPEMDGRSLVVLQ